MAGNAQVRGWRASLLVVAGASLAAGCGAGSGATQPGASIHQTTVAASTGMTATPSSKPGSALAAIRPCELLSSVDRSSAGLTSMGKEKTIGRARACDWTESGVFGLTITLDESAGLNDLKIDKGTGRKLTIGAHQALQVADRRKADGTCAVLLAAGNSASVQVDVNNANFADTELACERASTAAKLIEPKVPQA
ncbi:DUF3558 family protein [Amycolatopsis anabasis]|uniref:DUF3558 family protein n=1 Tax=Amycolatopsis anabasis TaxID=1840409 RepID=UPI00131E312D|nr:DUF3558 family protein [Amycolatopsis anabasis]